MQKPDTPDIEINGYNLTEILGDLMRWVYTQRGWLQKNFAVSPQQIEKQIVELFYAVQQCVKGQVEVMENFTTLYNFIKDFFDNLDLQEEVNIKLEQMVTDGTLTNIINQIFQELRTQIAELNDRIDSIIIDEGNTDAEIADARKTFTTLGNRLDSMDWYIDYAVQLLNHAGNYNLLMNAMKIGSVFYNHGSNKTSPSSTTFAYDRIRMKKGIQYHFHNIYGYFSSYQYGSGLDASAGTTREYDTYYGHGDISKNTSESAFILSPITMRAGEKLIIESIYGYFSCYTYDNQTYTALTESTTTNFSTEFTPEQNGRLYVTVNMSRENSFKITREGVTVPIDTSSTYTTGDYDLTAEQDGYLFITISTSADEWDVNIGRNSRNLETYTIYSKDLYVDPKNVWTHEGYSQNLFDTIQVNAVRENIINKAHYYSGRYYMRGETRLGRNQDTIAYEPIKFEGGKTYEINAIYGYFSSYVYLYEDTIRTFTESTTTSYSGEFTPERDGVMYLTVNKAAAATSHVVAYLDTEDSTYYDHGSANKRTSESSFTYFPMKIKKGEFFTLNGVYGYFSGIRYDQTATINPLTESTTTFYSTTVLAEDDGVLYITVNKAFTDQHSIIRGTYEGRITNSILYSPELFVDYQNILGYEMNILDEIVNINQLAYVQYYEGRYYGHNNNALTNSTTPNTRAFYPIKFRAGDVYQLTGIYGYFSNYEYVDSGEVNAFTESTTGNFTGEFVAEQDGYMYITLNRNATQLSSVVRGTYKGYLPEYIFISENLYVNEDNIISSDTFEISVGEGRMFEKVTDALNYVGTLPQISERIIHIYSGEYDLLSEMGGMAWAASVSTSGGERQGAQIPEGVYLQGHGSVVLKMDMPDANVSDAFGRCVSPLNFNGNGGIYDMTIIARNCRYVVHDEMASKSNITRKIKNVNMQHLGMSSSTSWQSNKALGGGTGNGGTYEIENCSFESNFVNMSYHGNNNQKTNRIYVMNCTCKGNTRYPQADIYFSYLGTGSDTMYVTASNCVTDNPIIIRQESSSVPSDNNIVETFINNVIRS